MTIHRETFCVSPDGKHYKDVVTYRYDSLCATCAHFTKVSFARQKPTGLHHEISCKQLPGVFNGLEASYCRDEHGKMHVLPNVRECTNHTPITVICPSSNTCDKMAKKYSKDNDEVSISIVNAIMDDISDRRGLKQALHSIDAGIFNEIKVTWADIVKECLGTPINVDI